MIEQNAPSETSCTLLYDGACPMCSAFARVADASEAGQLKKVDAREAGSLRSRATAAGMDLDFGIVVEHGGTLYYGPDALFYLASRPGRGLMSRLFYLPFRARWSARILYPVLVNVRRALLWLKGTPLIRNIPRSGE